MVSLSQNSVVPPLLAELGFDYGDRPRPWISVLVDCPQGEGCYTYRLPEGMTVEEGDIVSVPFGQQQLGGIVVGAWQEIPDELPPERIKPITDVVVSGFFSPEFWRLLHWVAEYYCTPLVTVVRMALPPGMLQGSQRRIRLHRDRIPPDWTLFLSHPSQRAARQLLDLLGRSPQGEYSYRYLKQKVPGAAKGVQELLKRHWVSSYLEFSQGPQVKYQKMVTLVGETGEEKLTEKQRAALATLKHQGGEWPLADLLKRVPCASSTVESLAKRGLVIIADREDLRLGASPKILPQTPPTLTSAQQNAYNYLQTLQGYHQVLLHGVTGSGKTEVYLRICGDRLAQGESVLVLVPEIGLTPQLMDRFRSRFGSRVVVYHSGLSQGERYDTWRQMLLGQAQVVIGTRSAIFAPLPRLGLIILDEEHDPSFKQTQLVPCYHARTVAQRRAQGENCLLILGSATPALETWQTLRLNPDRQSHYLSLPDRIGDKALPPVTLVDMRAELKQGNKSLFSRALQKALGELRAKGEQGILFVNRRGHSTFVSCRSCGHVLECPHCDVSLSYHYPKADGPSLLRCHYCNHSQPQPKTCPACGSPYLKFFGSGTQKVAEALAEEFPDLRWTRFDSDTTSHKGSHRELLDEFQRGEKDVLVGTQMLTKGLDIPQVTLVGVVAADSLLHFADYRSGERSFQTLTQVSGRAGRGKEPGRVIIQTYTPLHPVIQAVKTHDYLTFVAQELPHRQALTYPPYGRLILLRCSGLDLVTVEATIQAIAGYCRETLPKTVEILGPAPATIARIAQRYRWHLVLKYPQSESVILDPDHLRSLCSRHVHLAIDIDPLSLD